MQLTIDDEHVKPDGTPDDGIPNGHGLSFKKGVSDGMFERDDFRNTLPDGGHGSTYNRGRIFGAKVRLAVRNQERE
ncbi:MAG: hypothetical protein V4712_12365 [Pseudomonadota bacterium]